jgi:energy-coupling factor transport system ATP-binding protein
MATNELCKQIGFLPQDPNSLLFADTVYDELRITLANHQLSPEDYPIDDLLDRLGLIEKAGEYARDLSTGERQRVALGAILIAQPIVLLFDEPTRGLDYAAKDTLSAILSGLKALGIGILLVTHDVELAANLADRVAILDEGRLSAVGAPSKILSEYPAFRSQTAQLFPDYGWLTVEEVIAAYR